MPQSAYLCEYIVSCQRIPSEIFIKVYCLKCKVLRNRSYQFNHLGDVVIIFAVREIFRLPWVEQKITGYKLKYHACKRPQVGACVIVDA